MFNYKPKVTPIYILHEGFLGVFGDELKEIDYEDVDDDHHHHHHDDDDDYHDDDDDDDDDHDDDYDW